MINLTNLVKEYKQTKNKQILEQIFKILDKDIRKRVELIYRKIKYYKIEKADIKQELYIKILGIIDNYNPEEPFENYFFSCLKYWKPKLSKDDITIFESLYKTNKETDEEIEINVEDKNQENIYANIALEEIIKECKTETEKKICELLIDNPDMSQEEIAIKCKTYQRHISRIINNLRRRLKKFV